MNLTKKYLSLIIGGFLLLTFSSCIKDRNTGAPDFSNLQPLVEIRDNISGVGNDAGLAFFAKATLNFPATDEADTVSFYVNIASVNTLSHDLTVTVGVDPNTITTYNGDPTHTVHFEPFQDSSFSLLQTQVTIPAGQRVALVSVVIYPSKIDHTNPTTSYMLPISILDAQGVSISGNFGTIYYHTIGNPLAGDYNWDFTRYDNATGTGDPSGLSFTGNTTVLQPTSPTSLEVASGYYTQTARYEITFTNNGGTLSNFDVTLNADDIKNIFNANGITLVQAPKVLIADPVNKVFEFQYVVQNSSGFRWIVDKYYK